MAARQSALGYLEKKKEITGSAVSRRPRLEMMKTDKKELFQGAPKGGPSVALEPYSEDARRRRERNVRCAEGFKFVAQYLEQINMKQSHGGSRSTTVRMKKNGKKKSLDQLY